MGVGVGSGELGVSESGWVGFYFIYYKWVRYKRGGVGVVVFTFLKALKKLVTKCVFAMVCVWE